MIKNPDYGHYDYMTVAVKTDKSAELVSNYRIFGWRELETRDDNQYDDIRHSSFQRRHKLPNKDRLQYLQVCMEEELNSIGRNKHGMNARITLVSFVFGLLGSGLVTAGILSIVLLATVAAIVCGAFLTALGTGVLLALYPLVKKTTRKEKNRFSKSSEVSNAEIAAICEEAKIMAENKDE